MNRVKMFYLFLSVLMFSCNNGESDNLIENENEDWEIPREISFTYKDKSYYSECIVIDNNISYVVEDEVRAILNQLNQNSNLASVVIDGKIEYYDSYDEVCEKYNLLEEVSTKME
ncbi:MAG: hypothetical protein LUG51_03210 [Tannerellaceae bacterium]|nr:hypothetical protein [Tannerellaceae bacterium]